MTFKNVRLILLIEFFYVRWQIERAAYLAQGFFSLSTRERKVPEQRAPVWLPERTFFLRSICTLNY